MGKITKIGFFLKTFSVLAVLLLSLSIVSPAKTGGIQKLSAPAAYSYKFNQYFNEDLTGIEEKEEAKIFYGDYYIEESGKPRVPFNSERILIPKGKEISSISVSKAIKETIILSSTLEINQNYAPLIEISENADVEKINIDPSIKKDKLWPYADYNYYVQDYAGYDILYLSTYPMKYNPMTKEVIFYDLTIEIRYKDSQKNTGAKYSEEIISKLDSIVTKKDSFYYENLKKYEDSAAVQKTGNVDYVIITEERFRGNWDGTPEGECTLFSCLEKYKETRENPISVDIVSKEEILANDNYSDNSPYIVSLGNSVGMDFSDLYWFIEGHNDDAVKIRNFIREFYVNKNTKYILLGGDADLEVKDGIWGIDHETEPPVVPAKYLTINPALDNGQGIASDLYYSNLDGSFDSDGNGLFGYWRWWESYGDYIDYISEVYVGRAPVDSEEEVNTFIEKTIAYSESQIEAQDFAKKVLFVGSYIGFVGIANEAKPYLEEVREGSFYHNYATGGIPGNFDEDSLYHQDFEWTKEDVIQKINENDLFLVDNLGHSAVLQDMKLCNMPFDSPDAICEGGGTDLELLTNNNYFLGYTQGCYAGSFDNLHSPLIIGGEPAVIESDSIIEHMLLDDNGAFAYIANNRNGYGKYSSTDSPSNRFNREFVDALFNERKLTLGEAHADAKEENAVLSITDDPIRYVYYSLTLFGDPEVKVKIPEEEKPIADLPLRQPFESPVTGVFLISGTAKKGFSENAGFTSYKIEYKHADETEWSSDGISYLNNNEEVDKGFLAEFDTTKAENGPNIIRLTAYDGENYMSDEIILEIYNPVCGDLTEDDNVGVADITYFIGYLFRGFEEPNLWKANTNGDEKITVADITYLIAYIFRGGPEPQCTLPAEKASDPTEGMTEEELLKMIN